MNEHITINLFGKAYKFKADQNVSDAKAVVELLENEVGSVKANMPRSSVQNEITLLTQAALNIANGFVDLQHKHSSLIHNIANRSESLKQTMDAGLS